MGFSTSGAAAVLFVGVLIAVGMVYPTLETATDRRTAAMDDRDQRALDVRNTDLLITDATYDDGGTNATGETTVNVSNDGSTTLSAAETDLLVDGAYRPPNETRVEGDAGRDLWQPGETLTLSVPAERAPDRVKVVAGNGVADTETEVGSDGG